MKDIAVHRSVEVKEKSCTKNWSNEFMVHFQLCQSNWVCNEHKFYLACDLLFSQDDMGGVSSGSHVFAEPYRTRLMEIVRAKRKIPQYSIKLIPSTRKIDLLL